MTNKLLIRDNKALTDNPDEFIQGLLRYKRVKFEDKILKADVRHLESKNSHRETKITYYWKLNGHWQDFAFFCSKSITDIINDFRYEYSKLATA